MDHESIDSYVTFPCNLLRAMQPQNSCRDQGVLKINIQHGQNLRI